MTTPQEYFMMGASAMQSRVATILMIKGHMDIAPKVLEMDLPEFQIPESLEVEGK